MSEKKNIDRLFQEKFKDFEADPPEYVWDNIYHALQEKKKRRIIPIWWRYGGVAAILILGVLFSLPYISGPGNSKDPVVTAPQQHTPPGTTITAPRIQQDGTRDSDAIQYNNDVVAGTEGSNPNGATASGSDNDKATGHKAHQKINTPNRSITNGADNNGIAGANDNPTTAKQRKAGTKHTSGAINTQGKSAVATTGSSNNRQRNSSNNNNVIAIHKNGADTNAIAGTNNNTASKQRRTGSKPTGGTINTDGQSAVATTGSSKNNGQHNNGTRASNNNAGLNNDSRRSNRSAGQIVTNTAVADGATGRDARNTNISGVNDYVAVIDSVTNHALAEAVIDTTKVTLENELEKLLKEQQEGKKDEQVADNSSGKWSIKPQLAPVFYNSLSQGSPIDGQFASNAKSYDTDLSVGLGVNYALNKRLHVRGGINKVNLNYSTKGVEFYASLEGGTNNVSATAKSANIVVQDQGSAPTVNPVNAFSSQLGNNAFAGSMVQQTGYLEVPVEISYALVDSKFGIQVIGGVSTLFLNQNSVSVVSTQGLSTRVGEAQNLNNIHFSTNVGVGFRYRFFKAFEASFEPTFKYQVNTFSRDAGNFKPYFVGLYSGISFSF